jgi:hypothetical protein
MNYLYIYNKITLTPSCWLWTGAISPHGYARITDKVDGLKKTHLVHRIVYEMVNGDIPPGLTIDHLCHVRHCVNPRHLEAVTMQENARRMLRSTHCRSGGHDRSLPGATKKAGRLYICWQCHLRRQREYRHRLKLKALQVAS